MNPVASETHNTGIQMMKKLYFILILITGYSAVQCQVGEIGTKSVSKCSELVIEADMLFQEGRYDKCSDLLEVVLRTCDLSRSEKEQAMELMAKTYLETDEPGKAETAVNIMLKNYPHYELIDSDNPESFNRLVRKYKIHPLFSVGIRNTLDWMNYKTTRIFYLDGIHYEEPYKKELEGILNDFNWMYYGWAELEFAGDVSLNGDLTFMWTNFIRELETADYKLIFREQDNYIEIPLYVKKYFPVGKYVLPYVTAGMGWLYMTKATGSGTIDYPGDKPSVTTGDLSMLELRNRSTFEWIAGAGIGYKLKNLRLFIDARYYGGLKSITNPEKINGSNLVVNDYLYVDNYVRFNQFEIGASVSYTFINSVKRIRK
jgi:hypothetical protein